MPGIFGIVSNAPRSNLAADLAEMSRRLKHHSWSKADRHVDAANCQGPGRVSVGFGNAAEAPAPHGHNELDRSAAANLGGKALLFENVEGSDIPVAINTFGSYWRVNKALGTASLATLAERVQQLVKPEIPSTLLEKMKRLPDLMKMASFPPKSVRSGICQQVVLEGEKADLTRLPLIQCWPLDGNLDSGQVFDRAAAAGVTERGTGRYITFGGIFTKDPETGDRNIGMYWVQLFGPRKCAMHWHMHHDGARHFRMYQARGEKMPLAIALGGESVLPYAATAPLPPGIEELLFAGFLNGHGIELVPCRTIDLAVPANVLTSALFERFSSRGEGDFADKILSAMRKEFGGHDEKAAS